MISYDIDPSLHAAAPERMRLDDGCTAPNRHADSPVRACSDVAASTEESLTVKSDF